MNIGVVCYPTYGGSGIVATELGMEMAKRGHNVHFISYSQPARLDVLQEGIFYHPVEVESYPLFKYPPYTLALTSQIVEVTKAYKLDILHVHYAIPHASSALFAKKILADEGYDLKIITTLHGTDITLVGQHPSYNLTIAYSINHSDYVTSVSESLKEDTYSTFAVKKEIKVVPNFIDLSLYKGRMNSICRRNFAQDHEKLLVHVSNFRELKNVPDVVKIFAQVQKTIPSKLLLIGTGPDLEKVKKIINQLGIQEKVHFLGKINQINEVIALTDLFILPSSKESFGLAALEAMAAGVPVVSSNAGGIPEVNIDGKTGYLSEVHDIDDMSKNAISILQSNETLNLFKENAQNQAKVFSIEKIIPLYEALYEEAYKSRNL